MIWILLTCLLSKMSQSLLIVLFCLLRFFDKLDWLVFFLHLILAIGYFVLYAMRDESCKRMLWHMSNRSRILYEPFDLNAFFLYAWIFRFLWYDERSVALKPLFFLNSLPDCGSLEIAWQNQTQNYHTRNLLYIATI